MFQHQIVAVVKDAKEAFAKDLTAAHHLAAKPDPFTGLQRVFRPVMEQYAAQTPPNEIKRVTESVPGLIDRIKPSMIRAFDAVLTQDEGNMTARADVEVAGLTLKQVPATHLLFLEKRLTDLLTFASAFPTLDQSESWSPDSASGQWRSEPASSRRTAKVQKPLVLYPATAEHPAQTQIITEDVDTFVVETTKFSGMLSASAKARFVERARVLLAAVKAARQQANTIEVPQQKEGEAIFGYLFGA